MSSTELLTRRRIFSSLASAASAAALAACSKAEGWTGTDVTGRLPALNFAMTRANDGKRVTDADYLGKVVLLYFGYTSCPDICPVTLANLAAILRLVGPRADHARVLFVTVDPGRDTPDILRQYAGSFAPWVDALRGSADQLEAMARRYRVAFSAKGNEVVHGELVYLFDATGAARLVFERVSSAEADLTGIAHDVDRLL